LVWLAETQIYFFNREFPWSD